MILSVYIWIVQQVQDGTLIANHQRATFIESGPMFDEWMEGRFKEMTGKGRL